MFSPLVAYYSITALPDVTMLGFLTLGLYAVARATRTQRPRDMLLACIPLPLRGW